MFILQYQEFDSRQPLYIGSNICLICFSVVGRVDLISERWLPEVRHNVKADTKIILVGTKTDLRNDARVLDDLESQGMCPMDMEKGQRLARQLGVDGYLECSAKTQKGIQDVFKKSVEIALGRGPTMVPNAETQNECCCALQ